MAQRGRVNRRARAKERGGQAAPSHTPVGAEPFDPSLPPTIVAIGASAGGLEALEELFSSLRADTGLAFVVVQHLSPDFPSMMDELLARQSRMQILQARDGMKAEPNVIYLRPARRTLLISDGCFALHNEDESAHLSLPIDAFLQSLAQEQEKRAVAIILSGTGSDGTKGAAAIRERGGTVLVQEPSSARFDSMPRSILERNLATASAVPAALAEIIQRLASGLPIPTDEAGGDEDLGLDPETVILRLLQRRCGTDFGYYKMSTVGRRIRRRAEMARLDNLAEYAAKLKAEPDEIDLLTKDLLIGVTAFFRDPEAFEAVEDKVLPSIVSEMGPGRQIRVWVPGCATGEEAYSIAILLSEAARAAGTEINAKIFATDIFPPALERAARGVYEEESLANVAPELIERYFEPVNGRHQVKPTLRRLVVFSTHNLLKDPPFTRMDLISCRNLLIYFNDTAQRKVVSLFHLALNVGGLLFLGSSETLSEIADEFGIVDVRWRLFRKLRDIRLKDSLRLLPPSELRPDPQLTEARLPASRAVIPAPPQMRRSLAKAYDAILARYAPAGVLVDRQGLIVHVFGEARKYLSIKPGLFSANLSDSVSDELRHTINAGLERMRGAKPTAFARHVPFVDSGKSVKVTIERLDVVNWSEEEYCIVVFDDSAPAPRVQGDHIGEDSPISLGDIELYARRIKELEQELQVTEESLQSTIQEMETTNEELQATNEELMSANEELQSTNEELHSVNEELYTVSAEHQRKIDELLEVSADLQHVLTTTDVGVVYLDQELCLRRYTPAAATVFNLLERDIGRPIEHIRPRFHQFDLPSAIRAVGVDGRVREHEVDVEERSYLLRILPYEISDRRAGFGLTVIDITERKRSEQALKVSQSRLSAVVETAVDAFVVIDDRGLVQSFNPAAEKIFGYSASEVIGRRVDMLMPGPARHEHQSYVETYLKTGEAKVIGVGREVEAMRKDGRSILIDLVITEWRSGDHRYFTGIMRDITERKRIEAELAYRHAEIRRANAHLDQFAYIVSHDLRAPLRAVSNSAQWIIEDLSGHPDDNIQEHVQRIREHTERMYKMLDDLLKYSRVGHEDAPPEAIDLDELVLEICRPLVGTGVNAKVLGPVRTFTAARAAIDLVMRNLIENALCHNDRDKVNISIKCNDEGKRLRFEVSDDGPGISPEHHDRIFLPFRKIESRGRTAGSGMGLALVKRAVEDNGGIIEVVSDPASGRGTVFKFSWGKARPDFKRLR